MEVIQVIMGIVIVVVVVIVVGNRNRNNSSSSSSLPRLALTSLAQLPIAWIPGLLAASPFA